MSDEASRARKLATTLRWQANNREKHRAQRRALYLKNHEANRAKSRDRMRAWAAENPEKAKEVSFRRNLLVNYGLLPVDYERMRAEQGYRCASCGDFEDLTKPRGRGRLFVDHDHATGKVRKLLCDPCNRTVGHAKEDPVRLERCAEYLRRTT